jgi:hypothetical protein
MSLTGVKVTGAEGLSARLRQCPARLAGAIVQRGRSRKFGRFCRERRHASDHNAGVTRPLDFPSGLGAQAWAHHQLACLLAE